LFIVALKSPVNSKLGGKDSGAKKIKMGYWLILSYLSMLPCFLIVLLCGERDIFQGTFVQKLHNFISGGACDYFQYDFFSFFLSIVNSDSRIVQALKMNLIPFHLFTDLIYSSSYLWGVHLVECRKVVGFCCGERGEHACAKAEDVCCDRPNPFLQVTHQLSFP
jgi:hypothetical protein